MTFLRFPIKVLDTAKRVLYVFGGRVLTCSNVSGSAGSLSPVSQTSLDNAAEFVTPYSNVGVSSTSTSQWTTTTTTMAAAATFPSATGMSSPRTSSSMWLDSLIKQTVVIFTSFICFGRDRWALSNLYYSETCFHDFWGISYFFICLLSTAEFTILSRTIGLQGWMSYVPSFFFFFTMG